MTPPRALLPALLLVPAALAAPKADAPLTRIVFASCAHQDRPQPIWAAVAAARPELFLFIGDNIYGDSTDPKVLKAKYDKLNALPGYRRVRDLCPVLATWDDHDYGLNDAGAELSIREESQKLFLDAFNEPADSPRRKRAGVYDAQVFGPAGKRVQVILLDTRYFRSPLKKGPPPEDFKVRSAYVASDDPNATMLGDEQWRWLEEQLRRPAELRLLVSSVQVVADDHPFEKWANFPAERDRLFKLIKDTRANGVVVLSGDRHLAELCTMDAGVGYPLFDLTASGINMANRGYRPPERNGRRVATMTSGDHFGVVSIDWEKPDPVVYLQIRDEAGDVTIGQKLPLSLVGPPAAKTASAAPAEGAADLAKIAESVGKRVTVEFPVKSTGRSGPRVFLNSLASFRDAANFTVVIQPEAAEKMKATGIADPATHYNGKTVRVTGVVELRRDRPQIAVEDPAQIQAP